MFFIGGVRLRANRWEKSLCGSLRAITTRLLLFFHYHPSPSRKAVFKIKAESLSLCASEANDLIGVCVYKAEIQSLVQQAIFVANPR